MANYPDRVMKYKKKWTYINKVGDKYYLYAAHSERIKGTDKIRRVSDGYLGRITEDNGLIPPKVTSPVVTYEFGFSFPVCSCTDQILRGLRKSFSNYGEPVYVCSVSSYIYGMYDRELFEHSYLYLRFDSILYPNNFTSAQVSGIERKKHLKGNVLENDDYFKFARKSIIRIHESAVQWTKDFGLEGYFKFISEFIDTEIRTSKKYLVEDRFLNM